MKFTKETFKRTIRTFIQAAVSYLLVNIAVLDLSGDKATIKTALIGIAVSALSAGISAVMNLEKTEEKGGGEYTFDSWIKKFRGKALNPDGVSGVQCVDLIKHYCKNVIGMSKSYYDAWGNAIEWYNAFSDKPWLVKNFKKIPYEKGMKIRKGDIVIFKSASKYGHIAVCNGKYNSKSFEAYDENYKGTHAGMTLRTFEYDGNYNPLGFLRPKDRSNIITAPKVKAGTYKLTNVRGIYNGWGAATLRKKVKDITEDARKHTTSSKQNAEAFLKAGTEVTIYETKLLSSGNLWAKIPSGYICIWESDIDKKFIK
ncbi:MAG: CHAP domain-containing protein [Eubacterium sp.]|nr:CHAP domain-containing protein [Eubacterium sp.]